MSDRQDRFFDQRVVQRNVASGRVTKDEHRAFLEALPDAGENIRPREEGGDDDGYDRPRQSAANDGGRRRGNPLASQRRGRHGDGAAE